MQMLFFSSMYGLVMAEAQYLVSNLGQNFRPLSCDHHSPKHTANAVQLFVPKDIISQPIHIFPSTVSQSAIKHKPRKDRRCFFQQFVSKALDGARNSVGGPESLGLHQNFPDACARSSPPLLLHSTRRNICSSLKDYWTSKYYRNLSEDDVLKPILLVRNGQSVQTLPTVSFCT